MKKLANHSVKFVHKRSVKASADQLKEILEFMEPRFSRFTCALSEGCPVEACQQPASVANNGFCQEHAIRGLSGISCSKNQRTRLFCLIQRFYWFENNLKLSALWIFAILFKMAKILCSKSSTHSSVGYSLGYSLFIYSGA